MDIAIESPTIAAATGGPTSVIPVAWQALSDTWSGLPSWQIYKPFPCNILHTSANFAFKPLFLCTNFGTPRAPIWVRFQTSAQVFRTILASVADPDSQLKMT